MSAAQIYDWIKERNCQETLDFKKRAFRSYVQEIRKEYGISKPVSTRDYEAVEELPMGQQAQVDMGEIKIELQPEDTEKCIVLQWCFRIPDTSLYGGS